MSRKSTIVRFIQTAAPITSVLAPDLSARLLQTLFLSPRRRSLKPRERGAMASATTSTLRLRDGREIPLYLWGDDGPVVLLVHGWEGRGSQLSGFAAPLVARGFRVAAFDAPAHGAADGKRMSLPEMADIVEAAANRFGTLDAVLAHSLGAASTTIALGRGVRAKRVVYLASPENPGIYLKLAGNYLGFDDEVVRRTQRRLEERFNFRFQEARGTFLGPKMEIPALLVHDLDDREVVHRESERLAGAWPGAELISTKGLGHNRILLDPDVVEATVAFIAQEGSDHAGEVYETERCAA